MPAKSQSHSDAGSDAGFEPVIVGQTDPLPSPRFAFKTGYSGAEQIWLIDDHDAIRQVPTGDIGPGWPSRCGGGYYPDTDGYVEGYGRFGPLMFDPSGKYLLFSETRECRGVLGDPSRVLAYELSSGITRVLLETLTRIEMNASGAGVAVRVDHHGQVDEQPQPDEPPPDVFVFADGALERVPVSFVSLPLLPRGVSVQLEKLGDRVLLLADNVVPLERVGGKWQPSALFDGVDGISVKSIGTAASGDRVCGVAEHLHGNGDRIETLLWTIDAAGEWHAASIPPDTGGGSCAFSPDETRVTFGETNLVFDSAITTRIDPPPSDVADMDWPIGDEMYGLIREAEDIHAVRVDWSTLAWTEVPELASLDAMCDSTQITVVVPPPDTRDLTLVRLSCACTDCEISNTLTWLRSSGALKRIGEPFQHFDTLWPTGSGAIALPTPMTLAAEDPSWFYSIDANAQVRMAGPLDGPTGAIHGSAVPPVAQGLQ